MAERTDQEFEAERAAFLGAIVNSDARLKVVVAGPGTGKTFTFKELLRGIDPPTLVLTFIRNLVADLQEALGEIADVMTFHGFARWLLHSKDVMPGAHYYPFLPEIIDSDLSWIGPADVTLEAIEDAIRTLNEEDPALDVAHRSANYYNAVGHDYAVYSVLKYFQEDADQIPHYQQVVVDEYQDFNALEVALIEVLAAKNRILVAGDDDQALYAFKRASPDFLRRLWANQDWDQFPLPFSSRCPPVIVQATHLIVTEAEKRGLLKGRIAKPYECFLPTKRGDGERFPRILHAHCSVQMKKAPYMACYIEEKIREIPDGDVGDSLRDMNPTVLIIGPAFITRQIYDYLSPLLPNVEMKAREPATIDPLDGYWMLLKNPRSRLGWRIIMMIDVPEGIDKVLRQALDKHRELSDVLPDAYQRHHLRIVELIRKPLRDRALTPDETDAVQKATGRVVEELVGSREEEEEEEEELEPSLAEPGDRAQPTVLITGSLVGAKGLQAEHVFIVGLESGTLPEDEEAPSDTEVCEFLVALTRAKKSCHLVSCGRLFGEARKPSPFISWIGDLVNATYVNKEYFR